MLASPLLPDRRRAAPRQAAVTAPVILEERLRATQAELAALRQSYAQLLAQLSPPSELSVVARAR